jgi:hypothetical protein
MGCDGCLTPIKKSMHQYQCLMPVILAVWKVEFRWILVTAQIDKSLQVSHLNKKKENPKHGYVHLSHQQLWED